MLGLLLALTMGCQQGVPATTFAVDGERIGLALLTNESSNIGDLQAPSADPVRSPPTAGNGWSIYEEGQAPGRVKTPPATRSGELPPLKGFENRRPLTEEEKDKLDAVIDEAFREKTEAEQVAEQAARAPKLPPRPTQNVAPTTQPEVKWLSHEMWIIPLTVLFGLYAVWWCIANWREGRAMRAARAKEGATATSESEPTTSGARWLIVREEGAQEGPYTTDQVRCLWIAGRISLHAIIIDHFTRERIRLAGLVRIPGSEALCQDAPIPPVSSDRLAAVGAARNRVPLYGALVAAMVCLAALAALRMSSSTGQFWQVFGLACFVFISLLWYAIYGLKHWRDLLPSGRRHTDDVTAERIVEFPVRRSWLLRSFRVIGRPIMQRVRRFMAAVESEP